jgi:hypothetical protein
MAGTALQTAKPPGMECRRLYLFPIVWVSNLRCLMPSPTKAAWWLKGQTAWAQVAVWPIHCVRSYDLLTGRTVGSLELYSFFADTDHFIHREQTLCPDVTNAIG